MSTEIPIGTYLFTRLKQVGVEHIFGVPGDFNLKLLDHVYNVPGLKWIGTCNELNGTYACDGYSRESGKIGVMVTTFGVGELSALNGVSGAFAENVPVIHIVGQSPRFAQQNNVLLHHSPAPHGLKPNDHTAYEKASEPLCCVTEKLWDPETAADQIDNLITQVTLLKEPGTLFVPADMCNLMVSTKNFATPIAPEFPVHPDTVVVADAIIDALSKAKRPVVLNELFATRFNMRERTHKILEATGAYGYVTFLGRSSINENHPQFGGVYNGHVSFPGVVDEVENKSDLVLNIGAHVSDFNTGGMSRQIPYEKTIIVHAFYASVFGKNYDGVYFGHVLDRVLERLPTTYKAQVDASKPLIKVPNPELKGAITQAALPFVISKFLVPGDTLIAETGTYQYGSRGTVIPQDSLYFAQYYYSSIGFALPAAFGAAIGKTLTSNPYKRVHLVEGDGSAMMTIQEVASMVRFNLPITIFLINNDGYSIERCIWGPYQGYNDIPPNWKWRQLFETFGAKEGQCETYKAETLEELVALSENKEFRESSKPQLVEIMMDKYDYPPVLRQSTVIGAANNAYQVAQWSQLNGLK